MEEIDRFVNQKVQPLEAQIRRLQQVEAGLENNLEAATTDYEWLEARRNRQSWVIGAACLVLGITAGWAIFSLNIRHKSGSAQRTVASSTSTPSTPALPTLPSVPDETFTTLPCASNAWVVFLKSADGVTAPLIISDALLAERHRDRKNSLAGLINASRWNDTCSHARDVYTNHPDLSRVFLWAGPISGDQDVARKACANLQKYPVDCIPEPLF